MSIISGFEFLNSNKTISKVEVSLDNGVTYGLLYQSGQQQTHLDVGLSVSKSSVIFGNTATQQITYTANSDVSYTPSISTSNSYITATASNGTITITPSSAGITAAAGKMVETFIHLTLTPTTNFGIVVNNTATIKVGIREGVGTNELVCTKLVFINPETLEECSEYDFVIPDTTKGYSFTLINEIRSYYQDGSYKTINSGLLGFGPYYEAGTHTRAHTQVFAGTISFTGTITINVKVQQT